MVPIKIFTFVWLKAATQLTSVVDRMTARLAGSLLAIQAKLVSSRYASAKKLSRCENYTLNMHDSGWNRGSMATFDIAAQEFSMESSDSSGHAEATVCLMNGCYPMYVGGGYANSALSWDLEEYAGGSGHYEICVEGPRSDFEDPTSFSCEMYTIEQEGDDWWDGASLDIDNGETNGKSYTMENKYWQSNDLCLQEGCYPITVNGGNSDPSITYVWAVKDPAGDTVKRVFANSGVQDEVCVDY